jgi:hypothetical protein
LPLELWKLHAHFLYADKIIARQVIEFATRRKLVLKVQEPNHPPWQNWVLRTTRNTAGEISFDPTGEEPTGTVIIHDLTK